MIASRYIFLLCFILDLLSIIETGRRTIKPTSIAIGASGKFNSNRNKNPLNFNIISKIIDINNNIINTLAIARAVTLEFISSHLFLYIF